MFTKSIVAIVTPINKKSNVCQASLKKLINYHVASGTSAIVSVGTTGESATLNHNKHANVVIITLKLANKRIPVIAKTSANATAKAISLTQRFNNSSIVGCLTVTPYYNRPSQKSLYQHFKAIAKHTNLPQILYNVPSRTSCNLLPKTVSRLAKVKNIIKIKKATKNLTRVNQIKKLVSNNFVLLSSNNASALDFMQLSSHEVISVTANVAARNIAQMCKLAAKRHFAKARVINQRLMPLHNKLFVKPNPIPVK